MGALQLKRGTAARWMETNPILKSGEPGVEYDTGKMKIGDGVNQWSKLPYVGNEFILSVKEFSNLPKIGNSKFLYKVSNERMIYQWNDLTSSYETLNSFNPNTIKLINGGKANG